MLRLRRHSDLSDRYGSARIAYIEGVKRLDERIGFQFVIDRVPVFRRTDVEVNIEIAEAPCYSLL